MKVFLPDGTELELEDGASGADAARAIGEGLARAALGIKVDGDLRDLEAPLEDGARIAIVTSRDEDGLWLIRHDAAHVLAAAVTRKCSRTRSRPARPISTARPGSRTSSRMWAAASSVSGARKPSTPSRTASGSPPTTGVRFHSASNGARSNPSRSDRSITARASSRRAPTSRLPRPS